MNGVIDTLEMYVPDIVSAKLDFDKMLSKAQIIEKVLKLETVLGGMVLHYECNGRRLEMLYSPSMKRIWDEKGIAGSKVRYIQRDVKGNIIEDMCREGVLMSGGTFFVSCDRCVSVSFGSGSEAYDITTIEILEQ
jgi:hypothetical protein